MLKFICWLFGFGYKNKLDENLKKYEKKKK